VAKRSKKEIEKKEKEFKKKVKHTRMELELAQKGDRSAVALRYDIEKDAAPVILAAGRGEFAEEILRIAEENDIPFYEDKGLADLLLKLEIDTEIPQELYIIVAEVLAFIFRLDKMASKRELFIKKAKELESDE